jgi:hypothetical protein
VRARVSTRLFVFSVLCCVAGAVPAHAQTSGSASIKVAFWNIQSGKGEPGLSDRVQRFADTTNCSDFTKPVNAWAIGFVQETLTAALKDDPSIIALGLAEAWTSVCGSPSNVRKVLGWAANTPSKNGVALVARYGFAGPEVWQQLDTSLNTNPADTMWVVRVPVCIDAECSASIPVYAAHWYGVGSYKRQTYDKQAQQTIDFMKSTAGSAQHILIGDLNVWEGSSKVCTQNPINAGAGKLRAAGYIDAWPRIHGSAEGYTGMTNRSGCGSPLGYTWKRIDYSWSSPGYDPIDIQRFAVPEVPGDPAASDHYGIIATYARPGAPPVDAQPPAVQLVSPVNGSTTSDGLTFEVNATDNFGVDRVEIIEDGTVIHTLTSAPYRLACTMTRPDGVHTFQARAVDASGNVAMSNASTITVETSTQQPSTGPSGGTIVLHAHRATVLQGTWQRIPDAQAAGGALIGQPNAGRAKVGTAQANPADYFELTFSPQAGVPYRLWIRGRAAGDGWANDSVYAQFSGSVTSSGAATMRIGTSSAAVINLEDGSSAGLSGWGWQDNGYGIGVLGAPIYFDGQPQTLRIQTREDGLSIDQIVLSRDTYLLAAPGALANDTVLLPETTTVVAAPRKEIVVLASNATTIGGAWRAIADTSAADGIALGHPDAGAAKVGTALASPVNYVELTFDADANRPYRVWMRSKADRNSWSNDSAFVQFSGAVTPSGAPIYRIGSTDATAIVLEDTNGAGVSGWGWADNGYGAGVLGPLVVFEKSGPQTLRIQTREDGLRFDQIVLSSEQYLTEAPGATKNDTTILK